RRATTMFRIRLGKVALGFLMLSLAGAAGGTRRTVAGGPAAPPPPGEGGPEQRGKSDPPGAPLEARLVAKTDTYTLDLGGKTPEAFRKQIEDAKPTRTVPPAP